MAQGVFREPVLCNRVKRVQLLGSEGEIERVEVVDCLRGSKYSQIGQVYLLLTFGMAGKGAWMELSQKRT
jgi:hypothetical protein